jgi:hypothetical protein
MELIAGKVIGEMKGLVKVGLKLTEVDFLSFIMLPILFR